MEDKIKELKRDIINGYTYDDVELETHDLNETQYRCENLILENGKILYACRELRKNNTELEGAVIIYESTTEFLKAKTKDIINMINSAYYYNVREVEE